MTVRPTYEELELRIKALDEELAAEITERKQLEEALNNYYDRLEERLKELTAELSRKKIELELKAKELQESNDALTVLLKKRKTAKIELKEKILSNVEILIKPYLDKLKQNGLDERKRDILNIILTNLDKITSAFAHDLSSIPCSLTPKEIQIGNYIRQGNTNKEIADILFLSVKTVEFHRGNIRKKLGIKNQKINLRSRLSSIN